MRTIKKIFNNNIVNAVDENGEDVILVGAGVGYLTGRGKAVDESRVEREFHLTGLVRGGSFRVLLDIPYPVLKAVARVAAHLQETHGLTLTPAAEVALADHIAQAISRLDAGIPIYNSMLWETKMTYPTEFAVALQALEVVHTELGRKLPLDEAGFVTLHLVNAGLSSDPHRAMTLGAALREIIAIVERELDIVVDVSSPTSTRFLTHVKFVIQRITRNQTYSGSFDEFFQTLKAQNAHIYACAVAIGDYLDATFAARVTEEERMYLMLHLLKLHDELDAGSRKP